jgi:hypothetical protein
MTLDEYKETCADRLATLHRTVPPNIGADDVADLGITLPLAFLYKLALNGTEEESKA